MTVGDRPAATAADAAHRTAELDHHRHAYPLAAHLATNEHYAEMVAWHPFHALTVDVMTKALVSSERALVGLLPMKDRIVVV